VPLALEYAIWGLVPVSQKQSVTLVAAKLLVAFGGHVKGQASSPMLFLYFPAGQGAHPCNVEK
jgi:hypothetical protein